jgi:hypothetical protein
MGPDVRVWYWAKNDDIWHDIKFAPVVLELQPLLNQEEQLRIMSPLSVVWAALE